MMAVTYTDEDFDTTYEYGGYHRTPEGWKQVMPPFELLLFVLLVNAIVRARRREGTVVLRIRQYFLLCTSSLFTGRCKPNNSTSA